jgi:aspartate/tyrosine/aromatic aminotransferase
MQHCFPNFWSFVFLFSSDQSDNMTNKWHVYMTKDGRISLAGLSLAKCEYLADAIIDSYHNVSWKNDEQAL